MGQGSLIPRRRSEIETVGGLPERRFPDSLLAAAIIPFPLPRVFGCPSRNLIMTPAEGARNVS